MDIYIVEPSDDIYVIANKHDISVEKLISDNGLINPYALVSGQALVILYPEKTYIVKDGDTLTNIADTNGISIFQLIRNNPFLFNREYIYVGESLVIRYNTSKDIEVNGFTYVFLSRDILTKALPYLTYLSIYNYRISGNASIMNYGDDTDIIQIAKDYNTIPLLMVSAFSPTGELDIEQVYEILLESTQQDKLISEVLQIIRTKEYYGINLLIGNLTAYNQNLYLSVFTKLSVALRNEGLLFMLTISTNYTNKNDFSIDYNSISFLVDKIIFLEDIWKMKLQPPTPISNISIIKPFIKNVTSKVSPKFIAIGKPLIGYDWVIPFVPGSSDVRSLSLNSTIALAYEERVTIYLDDESQTPYFNYIKSIESVPENHIVWFIDARSIKALDDVIIENDLVGTGLWNITSYNQQVFSIINATYYIIKF